MTPLLICEEKLELTLFSWVVPFPSVYSLISWKLPGKQLGDLRVPRMLLRCIPWRQLKIIRITPPLQHKRIHSKSKPKPPPTIFLIPQSSSKGLTITASSTTTDATPDLPLCVFIYLLLPMTDTQYQHHSTKKRRRQVCLFGLSADPPTGEGGHLGIVTHLSSTMDLFDEVRVLPVYRHMFSVSFGGLQR